MVRGASSRARGARVSGSGDCVAWQVQRTQTEPAGCPRRSGSRVSGHAKIPVDGHDGWLFREFCDPGNAGCKMTRLRSRPKPARPYICRLIILIFYVDGALDLAGTPGEGEPVDDGLLVVADAGGEGAQVGLAVIGFYDGEPCFQVLAAGPPGHHLGEARDITGQGLDVRAAFGDLAELFLLFWAQAIGAGQQPAGDLAG